MIHSDEFIFSIANGPWIGTHEGKNIANAFSKVSAQKRIVVDSFEWARKPKKYIACLKSMPNLCKAA